MLIFFNIFVVGKIVENCYENDLKSTNYACTKPMWPKCIFFSWSFVVIVFGVLHFCGAEKSEKTDDMKNGTSDHALMPSISKTKSKMYFSTNFGKIFHSNLRFFDDVVPRCTVNFKQNFICI